MAAQQRLRLDLPSSASFDSFWPGPNQAAVQTLRDFALNADDGQLLLRGPVASGKSHLAQAACRARWDAGRQAAYLQLSQAPLDPAMLEGLSASGLIVVDELDHLRERDELPLLRLIDRVRAAGGKLLLCTRQSVETLPVQTPDLRSRLQWGASLPLKALDETALAQMLGHQARLLGVRLDARVIDYLLRRVARDPGALIRTLQNAVEHAVASGRQLTVPLLREVLDPLAAHE